MLFCMTNTFFNSDGSGGVLGVPIKGAKGSVWFDAAGNVVDAEVRWTEKPLGHRMTQKNWIELKSRARAIFEGLKPKKN